jgi:hypothetical protein
MRFKIAKLLVMVLVAPLARLAQRIGGAEIWISLIASKARPFDEMESLLASMDLQTEINMAERRAEEIARA